MRWTWTSAAYTPRSKTSAWHSEELEEDCRTLGSRTRILTVWHRNKRCWPGLLSSTGLRDINTWSGKIQMVILCFISVHYLFSNVCNRKVATKILANFTRKLFAKILISRLRKRHKAYFILASSLCPTFSESSCHAASRSSPQGMRSCRGRRSVWECSRTPAFLLRVRHVCRRERRLLFGHYAQEMWISATPSARQPQHHA